MADLSVFADQVIVITGASSGIGAEMARQLADQRAKLVLGARRVDLLEEVAAVCRTRGAEAEVVQTDVTDESQCKRLIDTAVKRFGRIDALFANAGQGQPRRLDKMSDLAQIKQEMDLNYYGVVYCVYHALPYLKQSKGRIVGTSSLIGFLRVPFLTGYVSAKHAMTGFLDTLRIELAGSGVSVTIAFPGAVLTDDVKAMTGQQIRNAELMTVGRAASIIVRAAAGRKRQVIMTTQGKFARWFEMIAPGLFDRLAASSMRE